MRSDERLRRMEADGILTPHQAALLDDSLAARPTEAAEGAPAARHRRPWAWALAAVAVLLVVGLAMFGGGPGHEAGGIQDVTQTLNEPGGYGQMNKPLSVALAAAALLVIPLLMWMGLHNSLVAKEERVFEGWAQVESNFQRRADLVPALVEAVSRYLKHESGTLIGVTEQRNQAVATFSTAIDELAAASKDSTEMLKAGGPTMTEDDAKLAALFAAQARISRGVQAVIAVAEDYPELRSADQFLELQAQIEGTENRINVARMRFNDAVRDYNAAIRKLPGSLVAAVGDFRRKAYFQSEEEARSAPSLDFD